MIQYGRNGQERLKRGHQPREKRHLWNPVRRYVNVLAFTCMHDTDPSFHFTTTSRVKNERDIGWPMIHSRWSSTHPHIYQPCPSTLQIPSERPLTSAVEESIWPQLIAYLKMQKLHAPILRTYFRYVVPWTSVSNLRSVWLKNEGIQDVSSHKMNWRAFTIFLI